MTVYVIGQLKFTDRAAYDRYMAAFPAVFAQFNGKLLAADEAPVVREGKWERDKVVLMSFPDEASLQAWADSPAYKQIERDRLAGADCVVLQVAGLGEEKRA